MQGGIWATVRFTIGVHLAKISVFAVKVVPVAPTNTLSPPVDAVVHQPLKACPALVGVGRGGPTNLPCAFVALVIFAGAPV